MKKSLLLLFALIISATLFAQERALNAPDTLNARGVNKDAIELTWSRVEGATKYNVYLFEELSIQILCTCLSGTFVFIIEF